MYLNEELIAELGLISEEEINSLFEGEDNHDEYEEEYPGLNTYLESIHA